VIVPDAREIRLLNEYMYNVCMYYCDTVYNKLLQGYFTQKVSHVGIAQ